MQPSQNIAQIGTLSGALAHTASLLLKEPGFADSSARNLLKMVPGQQQALFLFASTRRLAGDLEGARGVLAALAEAEPGLAAVHYELGLLLRDLDDNARAIEALSRVVELEPSHPSAWRALGDCFAKAGEAPAPDMPMPSIFAPARKKCALLEDAAFAGREHAQMAEAIFREALKVHPTDVPTLHALADLHMRQDRNRDAVNVLTQNAGPPAPIFPLSDISAAVAGIFPARLAARA